MGKMRKATLTVFILLISIIPIQDAQAQMVYSLEELKTKSDYIVYGICENVTRPPTAKYQLATLSVEKKYKGNISSTRIQLKLPDITDDTGRTIEVNAAQASKYLAFLKKSDTNLYEITFYNGLVPVKDGVFSAYTTGTRETFFKLTDTGWEPTAQAKLVVIDQVIPPNVTVNEWPWFYFNVVNEGGQISDGITFTWAGVSGEAYGTNISIPKDLFLYPNSYSGSIQVEVNFEKAGNYEILANGSKVGNMTVHEAGYSSDSITFSNMSFDLSKTNIMGVDLSFLIRNDGSKPKDITFILDARDARVHCIANLPADGNTTFSMPAGTGPLDYQRDYPGVRVVNIWYKGNIVLSGNYTVPPSAPPSDINQSSSYWVIAFIVVMVLVTTLFVKISLFRK